ncbi:MAG TPA: hypothetical protein VEX70_16415 [Pyrinomonadaceae bacterium]|nr:hypothetical protein [Pyrinomonadaceae bacterium]
MTKIHSSSPPSNPYAFVWQFFSLKNAGWILSVITLILLLVVLFKPSISQKLLDRLGISDVSQQDPLSVNGTWTYETNLITEKHPKGHNNVTAYKGENTIKIASNNNGYVMHGFRTHIKKVGEASFSEIDKQSIDLDNVGVNVDKSEFYFSFMVSQNNGTGYAVLKVNPSKTRMDGTVHYLFPDGTWDNVKIALYK